MQKLIDLADYVSRYNTVGRLKLSHLKMAIIQTKDFAHICNQIMQEFSCIETQSLVNFIGIGGYKHYRSDKLKNSEVHVINSIFGEQALEDQEFIKRKKHFQKLRINKQIIFVHLNPKRQFKQQNLSKIEILQFKRVDSSIKKDIFWKGSLKDIYQQINKIWLSINRCQLISCIQDLKMLAKQLEKDSKRENEWISLSKQLIDPTSFVLKLHRTSTQYLISSFEGFYSAESQHFLNNYSIHWQIMDILQDLWREQGQRINYQLQKMPLSYIQDILRLNDYNTIGGFLPQSCFLKIFKPILEETAEKVVYCLQAAKFKIMHNVQIVYEYYFAKTSVKQDLVQLQTKQIQKMCNSFLSQIESAINSQISYVYAPSSVFWQMRSVKSQLYSPQQQANIQIKYIGKVYVKRVFESIRQSVPRYIGQGLLRKISKYISQRSMQNLFEVLKQVPFTINLTQSELRQITNKRDMKIQCKRLINFFSLKVNSTYLLKNAQQKADKRWKQMYQNSIQSEETNDLLSTNQTREGKNGFFMRMKRFFTGKNKQQRNKRSKSIQKSQNVGNKEEIFQSNQKQTKHEAIVTDKVWILVIYGNKKLDDSRVIFASCQGFPQKLRPSIWFWLCSKRVQENNQVKLLDLLTKNTMDPQIVIQIDKDLNRTPPKELFKKKYRQSLKRVLSAYSLIDEQIQYTQGMNFVVSVIISTLVHYGIKDDYLSQNSQKLNIDDMQQKAFTIFQYFMLRKGFRRMMFIQRQYIAEICFRLQQRIRQLNPKVATMIQNSGFTCQIIFGPLIISGLLTWSSNIEIKKRIFDLILCRGIEVLYKTVAGVTAMCEIQIAKYKNQYVYDFLRNKALDTFYQNFGENGLTNLFNSF